MKIIVPRLELNASNLMEVFELQVGKMIEVGAPKEVKVDAALYLDQAMALTQCFTWSQSLAEDVGLNEVWFMDYRLSKQYLCEATGVKIGIDLAEYDVPFGDPLPKEFAVVQGQLGHKYKSVTSKDVWTKMDPLEFGGVIIEGLLPLIFWGKEPLNKVNMVFPGSANRDFVPYVEIGSNELWLCTTFNFYASLNFGMVTVAKPQSHI